MTNRYLTLVTLLILGVSIQICSAINCFTCNSMQEWACGDDFRIPTSDGNNRASCEGSCVKRRGERVSGSVRRIEVVRSCIVRRAEGCYNENFNALSMYSCSCNSEFCNSSSKVAYSASMVAFMSLSIVILTRLASCNKWFHA